MKRVTFTLNGKPASLEIDPDTPLLWALRDTLGLTGTKYGCGRGLCGCCTVLIAGEATRACMLPVSVVEGLSITTIEGLARQPGHPVIRAWQQVDVPQCGYCQPGQIVAATSLLRKRAAPTEEDIDAAMSGVLCRCGTYTRIREAIRQAAELQAQGVRA
jgi:isoquinoline 1-oxidoreductase alpha subunit